MKLATTIKSGMTKKRFLEWVKSKDDDDSYDYSQPSRCVIASFFRDTTVFSETRCGADYVRKSLYDSVIYFTDFFMKVMKFMENQESDIITIKELKQFLKIK